MWFYVGLTLCSSGRVVLRCRQRRIDQSGSSLAMFFQSLLPNFDIQVRSRSPIAEAGNDARHSCARFREHVSLFLIVVTGLDVHLIFPLRPLGQRSQKHNA